VDDLQVVTLDRRPSVLPKEHGAYGPLLFPLLTALTVGRRTPSALLLGAAAVCAFLTHEPLLVLLGQRGPRAAREQRSLARIWFTSTAVAAAAFAATAILTMRPSVSSIGTFAAPVVLAAALVILIASRREHRGAG